MSERTKIEWTEATWSPVTGCTRVSPGCERCYIERTPPFRMAHRRFDRDGIGGTTGVLLHPERLGRPLRWRKPRRVFVCSMADLFHKDVPDDYIVRVWNTIRRAPQHTFQVLTKRHDRMRSLLNSEDFQEEVHRAVGVGRNRPELAHYRKWPLPNIHLGVSVENQWAAKTRIPALLSTPAAVRWISAEPLLESVSLTHMDVEDRAPGMYWINALTGRNTDMGRPCPDVASLDWVVAGGESGPDARPMHPDWVRSLRDQCVTAGVPFLFKQWGEFRPAERGDDVAQMTCIQASTGVVVQHDEKRDDLAPGGWAAMRRVGKKAAGRELDGREWDQYPDG